LTPSTTLPIFYPPSEPSSPGTPPPTPTVQACDLTEDKDEVEQTITPHHIVMPIIPSPGPSSHIILDILLIFQAITLEKINFSYSILFHLTISYSSYFKGKKGISRNKMNFFFLMYQQLVRENQDDTEHLDYVFMAGYDDIIAEAIKDMNSNLKSLVKAQL